MHGRSGRRRRHIGAYGLPAEPAGLRLGGGSVWTAGLSSSPSREEHLSESGQPPIRVYKEHDVWTVADGEGVTEHHASREEAESAADAVDKAEERAVVVEEKRSWKGSRNLGSPGGGQQSASLLSVPPLASFANLPFTYGWARPMVSASSNKCA